jgi:ribosomal protein L21
MYAVIKTGGKQYRVAANDKITVEKLVGEKGDHVHFTEVLLVAEGERVDVGTPFLSGATVVGEIDGQEKSPTVYIFKKRRRKHYRRRNGHRQLLTSVTITDILLNGAKPTTKAAAPKPVATPAPKVETPKAAAPAPKPVAPPPAPKVEAVKVEPKKVEPVRVETPRVVETVKAEAPHIKDDGSHIMKAVRGETVQGATRTEHAVQGAHRVETVHVQDRDHSHILATQKSETVQGTTTTNRVATPVQGERRVETVHVKDTDNSHLVGTIRGETKVAKLSPDDISLIGGIGPKIEAALRAKGINTWAQIAAWTPADIESYNEEMKLMGRIGREEWIEQAKELMAGKPPRAKTDKARKDQE